MGRLIKIYALLLFFVLLSCGRSNKKAVNKEIVVCGWDEVFIIDAAKIDANGKFPAKKWIWRAKDRVDLPNDYKGLFGTTDECKPYDEGNKILITSSEGGVALVDRKEDKVLFYAKATNAHSAELLPHDRVAVASSFSDNTGKGNRLIIFDIDKPGQEILSKPLPGAHGVVWDEKRRLLWALSTADLQIFRLDKWNTPRPDLKHISTIALPDSDGHDLYPLADSPYLSVTTHSHCWLFHRDSLKFIPHPLLADEVRVKSVSQHPQTGEVIYVQAEGENWWAERIHFAEQNKMLYQPGEHFYKARWNIQIQ